ncbi:unnamed protein product [Closterium sp. NIES-65]|nr:unnamed protein product [Closterium sp. NIES-65]
MRGARGSIERNANAVGGNLERAIRIARGNRQLPAYLLFLVALISLSVLISQSSDWTPSAVFDNADSITRPPFSPPCSHPCPPPLSPSPPCSPPAPFLPHLPPSCPSCPLPAPPAPFLPACLALSSPRSSYLSTSLLFPHPPPLHPTTGLQGSRPVRPSLHSHRSVTLSPALGPLDFPLLPPPRIYLPSPARPPPLHPTTGLQGSPSISPSPLPHPPPLHPATGLQGCRTIRPCPHSHCSQVYVSNVVPSAHVPTLIAPKLPLSCPGAPFSPSLLPWGPFLSLSLALGPLSLPPLALGPLSLLPWGPFLSCPGAPFSPSAPCFSLPPLCLLSASSLLPSPPLSSPLLPSPPLSSPLLPSPPLSSPLLPSPPLSSPLLPSPPLSSSLLPSPPLSSPLLPSPSHLPFTPLQGFRAAAPSAHLATLIAPKLPLPCSLWLPFSLHFPVSPPPPTSPSRHYRASDQSPHLPISPLSSLPSSLFLALFPFSLSLPILSSPPQPPPIHAATGIQGSSPICSSPHSHRSQAPSPPPPLHSLTGLQGSSHIRPSRHSHRSQPPSPLLPLTPFLPPFPRLPSPSHLPFTPLQGFRTVAPSAHLSTLIAPKLEPAAALAEGVRRDVQLIIRNLTSSTDFGFASCDAPEGAVSSGGGEWLAVVWRGGVAPTQLDSAAHAEGAPVGDKVLDLKRCLLKRLPELNLLYISTDERSPGFFDPLKDPLPSATSSAVAFPASLLKRLLELVQPGRFLYISTDERSPGFFDPLKEKFNVRMLGDFKDLWAPGSAWYQVYSDMLGKDVTFDSYMEVCCVVVCGGKWWDAVVYSDMLGKDVTFDSYMEVYSDMLGKNVEFDSYMEAMVDYEVTRLAQKAIETFNDLTSDPRDGMQS